MLAGVVHDASIQDRDGASNEPARAGGGERRGWRVIVDGGDGVDGKESR
jgi:hypothetical protein